MEFEIKAINANHNPDRRCKMLALASLALPGVWHSALAESVGRPEPVARLQVLHWWTSSSEAKAVKVLALALAHEHIVWQDAAIPGAAGFGAGKVLKNRMLAGSAPDVAQLNGVNLAEWAALGLLQQLDAIAMRGNWQARLYPAVWELVRRQQHVVAAPLGIHRINMLIYNKALFARFGLQPPATWSQFEQAAAKFRQAGVMALAQSSEAWQVATLFESLILAQGGADYYRELFVEKQQAAFADERLTRALLHLRALKQWMPAAMQEDAWQDCVKSVGEGRAAMHIGGDWGKGELNALGLVTDDKFGALAVPDTAQYHLYCVDSLAMLAGDGTRRSAQERLAAMALAPELQMKLSRVKGSIPVLAPAVLGNLAAGMDSCARESARLFALGAKVQVPSLVHRMATDDATKDAIIAEVQRFFMDDRAQVGKTRERLAEIVHALRQFGNKMD